MGRGPVNESALEYDYMTRHLTMSVIFLSWTGTAVVIGSVGNIFVSTAVVCHAVHFLSDRLLSALFKAHFLNSYKSIRKKAKAKLGIKGNSSYCNKDS